MVDGRSEPSLHKTTRVNRYAPSRYGNTMRKLIEEILAFLQRIRHQHTVSQKS